MGALRFIIIFAQIIFKGCMESPAIRTALIVLSGIAALTFIPYWVGLLVVGTIFPPPAWAGGMICIILTALVVMILAVVYMGIYECVKHNMEKRK